MSAAVELPEILASLRKTFGYSTFRPLQQEIVDAILGGQDVFVLMPTGGGKSLCYQLPALLRPGMTLVISPLIALMKDQVDALQALGVQATFINSSLDFAEIGRRQAAVARGEVKLLYVAPERLMAPGFLQFLKGVPLNMFAIDEAHCISEWGHDFRPEYRDLRRLRQTFPSVTLGAFTATATPRVRSDIQEQLGLQDAPTFLGSFNRPNLFYDVRPKVAADRQLLAFAREHPDASGIVYCLARAETERVAGLLRDAGLSATAYHAALGNEERRRRQEAFVRDDIRIMVATIAFGMGIDKPDVRFVVHYDMPKTLEGYYQESGRAGRDGEPSDCVLFFNYGDIGKHEHFIRQKATEAEQAVAREQFRRMADWAQTSTCRRRVLLAYFDEPFDSQDGPCCDLCSNPSAREDYTVAAQKFLSCVKRTGERFGMTYVIDVLRGSPEERILRAGHDKLSTYGIGRDRPKEEWQWLARQLLQGDFIRQEGEYNVLTVAERGHAVLFKGESVLLAPNPRSRHVRVIGASSGSSSSGRTTSAATSTLPPLLATHQLLFDELRSLRKRVADERGVPPYVVFHDRVLQQMAAALPRSRADLLHISGVGERKVEDFGDVFLAAIAEHVRRASLEPVAWTPPAATPSERPQGLSSTVRRTLDLFIEGNDLSAIATTRQLTLNTLEDHLAQAIEAGEDVDIGRVVAPDKQRVIEAAIAAIEPSPFLKPIMERLGDGYTYGEIRFVRAALQRSTQDNEG